MENITGSKLTIKQRHLLKEALQNNQYSLLPKEYTQLHRNAFDKIKPKLRKEWELNTGQKWPVYEIHTNPRRIEKPYDGHHIIPVKYGGNNEWWNLHPAHGLYEHGRIHQTNSILWQILTQKK